MSVFVNGTEEEFFARYRGGMRFAEALAVITKTLAPGDPLAQLIIKAAEAKVPLKCETCRHFEQPPHSSELCAMGDEEDWHSAKPDHLCTEWEPKQ